MIGKKVRVFWPVDESWYTGIVQEYDSTSGEHLLKYQDGDTEWVKIGENNTTGMPQGNSPGPGGPMDIPAPPPPQDSSAMDLHAMKGGGGREAPDMQRSEQQRSDDRRWSGGPQEGGYSSNPYFHPGAYGPGSVPPGSMGPYGGMPGMPGMGPYGMMYPAGAYAAGHMGYNPAYGALPGGMGKGDDRGDSNPYGRRKTGPKAWSKHEDELLLSIVQSMQWPMKWTVVAQSLPDRTGKQCRERYVNHLNPRLKVSDWTLAEDATIFHLYNAIGSHWARMSKVIPGRTDNGIKNRFHNIRRQYEREDEHRLRLSANADFPEEIRLDRIRAFPKHLKGNSSELWDLQEAIGILAAQSVLGNGNTSSRNSNRFGPFRNGKDGELCARCGFIIPSLQTGREVCTKTGWCKSCTKVPPHASSNFLRECLNLRRSTDKELREIIESWEELFVSKSKGESEEKEEDAPAKEEDAPVKEAETPNGVTVDA